MSARCAQAHACIQQTALDLVADGWTVHVPADAVTSQRAFDRSTALRLMARGGVNITTVCVCARGCAGLVCTRRPGPQVESVMLTLARDARHPAFKQLSKLMISHAADASLTRLQHD